MKQLIAGAAALAVVVGAGYVLLVHNPLKAGSVSSPGQQHLLPDVSSGHDGGYVYRYVAGADYYSLTTIRNDGPFPVTINAATPEDQELPGPNTIEYLVAGRVGHDGAVAFTSAAQSPRLVSESLAPGEQLAIWLHWGMGLCDREGRLPHSSGSGVSIVQAPINWSVLGVPRTNWVPLVQNLEIRNIEGDPHLVCQGSG